MNKEELVQIINSYKKYYDSISIIENILKITISNNSLTSYIKYSFEKYLNIYLTDGGINVIYMAIYSNNIDMNSLWEDIQPYMHKPILNISKEEFIDLVTYYKAFDNNIDKLTDACNCNIFESDICTLGGLLFDKSIEAYFSKEAVDTLDWYLYDKAHYPKLKMTDSQGKEIPTNTITDIWNIVKEYKK